MRYSIIVMICFGLIGCTMSVNMVHTSGEASDVVDETQETDPTVDPNISVPVGLNDKP